MLSESVTLLGEYSIFFSMSVRPRVSLKKMMQKKKPRKERKAKIQIDPKTYSSESIINSKVVDMTIKTIN